MLYISGQGVEKNKEKAVELVSSVIESGVVEGYLISGLAAADENDYVLALECFHKVLDGTEPVFMAVAMNNMGIMYKNGLGVEQDYAKAMEWFEKSVELNNNNSIAMCWIGYMYEYGDGVEPDYEKAMEWYMKSAELNNYEAMTYIAELYENGLGVKQDYNEAMRWYNKAEDVMKATQK